MGNSLKGTHRASVLPPEIASEPPALQLQWLETAAAHAVMTRTSIRRHRKALRACQRAVSAGDYSPAPVLHRLCCSPAWADDCAAQLCANSQARVFDGMKRALADSGFYPPANDHPVPAQATRYDRFTKRRHPISHPASALIDRTNDMRRAKFTLNTRRRGKQIIPDELEQQILWPATYVNGSGRTFDRQLFDLWKIAGKVYSAKKPTTESASAEGLAALGMALTYKTAADVGADPATFTEQPLIPVVVSPVEENLPEDMPSLLREIRIFNERGLNADDARRAVRKLSRHGRAKEAAALFADMNSDSDV